MPKLHTAAETIGFCGKMIDYGWVTVAEADDRVVGFLARDGEEICALYMLRQVSGKGVGRQLLDHANGQSPRLWLRTWQANAGAQRFYRKQGFVETGRGDGSATDENMPDVTYVWTREKDAT